MTQPQQSPRELLAAAATALVDERRQLTMDELTALAALPDEHTAALAAVAHEVRLAWCGPMVEVEGILSVKTGGCSEDCSFCSQSAKFDSPVKATPLLSIEEVVKAAEETKATGATEFCLVLALRGPDEKVMRWLEEVTPVIIERTGMQVAVSAGVLDPSQAARLRAVGVHRYNHNLETARSFFGRIVTTHSWEERFETCQMVRAEGMELCCGVLFGMGENDAQRLELIGQLRDVEPAEVPVNFLNPRPGTPLSERPLVGALEAIKWIALLRLALPTVILRLAGGREVTLRDLQSMGMTSGINALIVGNYLTTLGRSAEQDLKMLEDLKMPVGALSAAL